MVFPKTVAPNLPNITSPCCELAQIEEQGSSDTYFKGLQNTLAYPLSWSQLQDATEDLVMAEKRFEGVKKTLYEYENLLEGYQKYCIQENVETDLPAINVVYQIKEIIDRLILDHESVLSQKTHTAEEHFQKMVRIDQIYRALLNLQTPAARLLSWSSQTYRVSKVAQFFDGAKFKKEDVNYDRWQARRVTKIERQMLDVYGFDSNRVELLMASSGAAAYNVLEKYLLLHVLKPNDKVLIVPNMFDEQQDWAFRDVPYLNVITEDRFTTDDIVDGINQIKPKVVFIDPLKNMQDARKTDILGVIQQLCVKWQGEDLYIIIDDTMLPAAVDPFKVADSNPKLNIMLFCSCAKYMQLGQDNMMAGLLAFPVDMSKRMKNIRMFHGTILGDGAAWSYPYYDRDYHIWRMKRMTRNSLIMAQIFRENKELGKFFKPIYPALTDHPDYEISKQFEFAAGTLNLQLIPQVENPRENLHDILDEMILSIVAQAKIDGTAMAWGEATGFGIPRIQVYLEYLWRIPPFLRISVGDRSILETDRVAKSIASGLLAYIHLNKHRFIFDGISRLSSANETLAVVNSTESSYQHETGYFDQGTYLRT